MSPDTAADGSVRWSATFRASAYNDKSGMRADLDTTIRVVARGAAGRTDYVSGLLQLPLTPGDWQIAVLAKDPSGANRAYTLDRSVPVASTNTLALSDLILGRIGGTPQWRGRAEPVPVNPLGTWPAETPVESYAEVYGLSAGKEYTVEFAAEPVGDARKRGIKLSGREQAAGEVAVVRRQIDFARLPAGRYRLQLTIQTGGRIVKAEREIVVLKPNSRE
jgi:hypothetical protein